MGSELAFWTFHKDPPKEVEDKDEEYVKKQRSRTGSVFAGTTEQPIMDSQASYQPEKVGKRRFSLDFILGRRSSKGKLKIVSDKRSNSTTTDSGSSTPPAHNQSRRGSTRMEGNSELAAWCIV